MSKIEWTEKTYNPIVGCTEISEGCKNCYAKTMAFRLERMDATKEKYKSLTTDYPPKWTGEVRFCEKTLKDPLNRKKPTMYFVCSMGDLFHESVPFEWIDKVFAVMQKCPQHIFQILTKRPKQMKEYFISRGIEKPYLNVWLGVTVENEQRANERILILLDIPAVKRFVSCEPLLSKIDLTRGFDYTNETAICYLTGDWFSSPRQEVPYEGAKIDWVIAGPETGPGARPMKNVWIANLYMQCRDSNVPFFDKKNTLELNIKQLPK